MFDAILDKVLTVQGVTFLTYALLVISLLVYLRIILGGDFLKRLKELPSALPAMGKSKQVSENKLGAGLNKLRERASGMSFGGGASYDNISMTGGDGRGTVSEVLARQTEIKILKGEEVPDDFTQELTQGTSSTPILEREEEPEESKPKPAETKTEPEPEPTPDPVLEPEASKTSPTPSAFDFQFDGFSVGDFYDAPSNK